MKITLFTSDQLRHNYLINLLSNIAIKLYVIQESVYNNSNDLSNNSHSSDLAKNYFLKVSNAQKKIFGDSFILNNKKNINLLSLNNNTLNDHSIDFFSDFLKSDIYIIFGSSYIKSDLANFLIKHQALNIHMGVSPYYRGADCNFWALYDNNPHLVGATIHMLSKGLDSGPILYHALSSIKKNSFEYTMSTVKSAFQSLAERIKNESIFNFKPAAQNKKEEVRYSKKNEFNDFAIKSFFERDVDLNLKKFDPNLYKDPYILEN